MPPFGAKDCASIVCGTLAGPMRNSPRSATFFTFVSFSSTPSPGGEGLSVPQSKGASWRLYLLKDPRWSTWFCQAALAHRSVEYMLRGLLECCGFCAVALGCLRLLRSCVGIRSMDEDSISYDTYNVKRDVPLLSGANMVAGGCKPQGFLSIRVGQTSD